MLSLDFLVGDILLSSEVAPNAHQPGAKEAPERALIHLVSWLFAGAASLSSRANDKS